MDQERYLQIDLLKAFAILSVIAIHTFPAEYLYASFSSFHYWQAVPIFVVLMGLNATLALDRKGRIPSLGNLISPVYYSKFLLRYGLAFGLLLFAFFVAGTLLEFLTDKSLLQWSGFVALGLLPMSAPGNYFILLIIGFVIAFPFVYRLYLSRPVMTILVCFAISLGFELVAFQVVWVGDYQYLYSGNVLRFLGPIALGIHIWHTRNESIWRKPLLVIGTVMSSGYLLVTSMGVFDMPLIRPEIGNQNVFAMFYPAALVMLGWRFLPRFSVSKVLNGIGWVGKRSYHIFLAQMLYFGVGYSTTGYLLEKILGHPVQSVPMNILELFGNFMICLAMALLLIRVESILRALILNTRSSNTVEPAGNR